MSRRPRRLLVAAAACAGLAACDLSDEFSGRVMEYSWHQILGQPAVDCPHAGACFCAKFGLCGLDCAEHGCRGRYFFKFGELPPNWPHEGPGTDGWPAKDWYLAEGASGA